MSGYLKISDVADSDNLSRIETSSYTLVLTDAGKFIQMSVATANTLTIPPNSSVAFPINTEILFSQAGVGQVTITPGVGVTVNAADAALKSRKQHSVAGIVKIDTNTWLAFGDLST